MTLLLSSYRAAPFRNRQPSHVEVKITNLSVPPGLWHCPFYFRRVDHPIVFNTCSRAPILYEHINHDPKWAHLANPPQIDEIID